MASLALYIDTTSNSLIAGVNDFSSVDPATLPFFFGDTLNLQVYLMNKTGTTLSGSNPYTVIVTAGITFFLYFTDGKATATIYTQQISWNSDPANQYFYSTLSLNTAALQTLLGTSTGASCYMKAGYIQNGLQTTVLSAVVNIGVGIPSTNLVVPANLTPLSVEVARAMFVPEDGAPANPGQGFFLLTPNGKKLYIHATDNPDGTASFNADPL